MKKSALKSIINDLNMAGIFDIPASTFMDFEKIDSRPIVKQAFEITEQAENTIVKITPDPSLPSSEEMANQISALFSTFDETKKRELAEGEEEQELIEITTIAAKPVVQERQPYRRESKKAQIQAPVQQKTEKPKPVKLPNPEKFISVKQAEKSKIIAIINIENEEKLKNSEEFTLLDNILKTMNSTIKDTSLIFIDNSYKKITLEHSNYLQELANYLQKSVKSLSEELVFCFGEDCLKLATDQQATIRNSCKQQIDAFDGKKLLANYSLSAMMNNPKYKKITWTNILLIKENNETF